MSFLYTLFFAGLMVASNGNLQKSEYYNYVASETGTAIKTDETERFAQTYPLNADGKVSVSNVNGSITIETWDQPEVKFEYVKSGKTKESLAEVEVVIDARQDAFSVESDYGDRQKRNSGGKSSYGNDLEIEYRLTVPRRAVLDEIETVNGSVSVSNAENTTKASAVNGEIRANNLRGAANLSTVNGTVTANFDWLATGSRINLETVNGSVNLTIPSDANATLKAETVNGKITNDFNLPVRKGQYVGRDMYGKIGTGDVPIKLESVNGELSVKHKNDGKTLSPATNLLSPKNKGDEDRDEGGDDEGYFRPQPPKPPKAPRNPVLPPNAALPAPPTPPEFDDGNFDAAMRREIEQALKEAEKEIGKMTPAMRKQIEDQVKAAKAGFDAEEMRAQIKAAREQYQQAAAQMSNAKFASGSPTIEEKNGSFAVKGIPKVTVETKACDVIVRGWDKPEVSYSVVKIVRSGGKPIDEQWTISATKNNDSDISFKIFSETKSGSVIYDDATKVRLEIFVPRKSNLKITTGGEIRLENVSGKIDLKGDDEAINVRDGDGELSVISDDARVRVIGFKGAVDAKNEDGTMNFEGDFQNLNAETTDGTIVLTLPENANADIESNSKEIVGEGFTPNYTGDAKNGFVWKIGAGGSKHRLSATEDGRIIVRSANALKVVQ
ncbi:MAG: DUF4097 family beta strand repeat-containing protein [Acidobacteriota bacterium]|nr:DUF4097 family beta strand repeat-containing protein [Acidobacteriota bacterium]